MTTPPGNPYTPSIPELSQTWTYGLQVSGYTLTSALAMFIWDTVINLEDDYQLLFKHTIRPPTVVYYLSRASTLTSILASLVLQIGNIGDCQALLAFICVSIILTVSMTSMLFLLRVTAVYHDNKVAIRLFVFLWLAVSSMPILTPVILLEVHAGTTQQCNIAVPSNGKAIECLAILLLINDTVIFLAISYRVLKFPLIDYSLKSWAKVFFDKGSLPIVSRLLLQSGQYYYLISACLYILFLVLDLLPGFNAYHRIGIYSIPLLINNVMACIVFRQVKFGLITHDGSSLSNIEFTIPSSNPTGGTLPSHHADQPSQDPVSSPKPQSRRRGDMEDRE
ncbi:hypothetical protein BDQ12DRAFT_97634 [Crucibulum laeve]|uniref:DUF6533 domain-containing protein n=1 Tax=Crucibulum laeve TaxID=68775 RepID=A0A5C3M114_9AGAR|nr:hypothetical protein BDQ12DRAFT_97634 [Crucibulum laeve]